MDHQLTCNGLYTNNLVTCLYLPMIAIYIHITNNLYNFGKEYTHVELILITIELMKYYFCHMRQTKNLKKSTPVRKFEFNNLLGSIFVLVCVIATFYVIAVLFGAPLLSKHFETLSFAILLTILTALPCCLHLGKGSVPLLFTSLLEFEGNDIYLAFLINIRVTLFGAWVGAVLIPLDWNRPYQEWPIPCYYGAMTGSFLANLILLVPTKYFLGSRKINRFNL